MAEVKNAFHWRGQPSVFSKDPAFTYGAVKSQQARVEARERERVTGVGWGNGFIAGISDKADAQQGGVPKERLTVRVKPARG